MANQSTQKYIDGEKDWITAMLASQPIVEGKSRNRSRSRNSRSRSSRW